MCLTSKFYRKIEIEIYLIKSHTSKERKQLKPNHWDFGSCRTDFDGDYDWSEISDLQTVVIQPNIYFAKARDLERLSYAQYHQDI